jgi:hypothetical protein
VTPEFLERHLPGPAHVAGVQLPPHLPGDDLAEND